jgi:hypothetical protein
VRVLAAGDSYMPPGYLERVLARLESVHEIEHFMSTRGDRSRR